LENHQAGGGPEIPEMEAVSCEIFQYWKEINIARIPPELEYAFQNWNLPTVGGDVTH